MTIFQMDQDLLYKLISMSRGATSTTPISHRCNMPLNSITVDFKGNCFLCNCDGWLPVPVGTVEDFDSIQELMASQRAKTIQHDVVNGHFSWCAIDHCGVRHKNINVPQMNLYINIDESCNLQCPSCRKNAIMISSGPEFDKKHNQIKKIINWLETYDRPIHTTMSGNGDVLASHIMRPLIKTYKPRPNQTFTIFTNGLLIKKNFDQHVPIFKQTRNIMISVDAASEAVYEDVRRPGKWDVLLDNLEYLAGLNGPRVSLNFVVQNKNFRDIPAFVELCQRYNFAGYFQALRDWGTWSQMPAQTADSWTVVNGIFSEHDILNPAHKNHAECMTLLAQAQTARNIHFAAKIQSNLV